MENAEVKAAITTYGHDCLLYGPQREKTCLQEFANNKGADRPISAFVIRFLESTISKLATSKF